MIRSILMVALFFTGIFIYSDQLFPPEGWKDEPDPLASPDAEVGGEVVVFAGQFPQSFNYYLDTNTFTAELFSLMYHNLISLHPVELEYEPSIAEKWSISDDKKSFTFWIDKRAKWSDGNPIIAEDVKWTFDAIMDPKNLTGPHKVSLEKFDSPTIIDKYTIRFTAREVHWKNLTAVGGFEILPKHIFENKDFNKANFEFPVVSGLYKLGEVRESIFVKLVRRTDWWRKDYASSQGVGNFETIKFKFFAERENAFEAFKKGLIDIYPVHTARLWVNETKGEKFDKNWIVKQKIKNYNPIGFQGFAMNTRKSPFNDIKVRKAMAHLLDRRKMNETLMYGQYFLHRSYTEDLYGKDIPCPNTLVEFDKEKASQLLKEAGWIVNPETGILEKDGKPFRFKFLTRDASVEKFISIYAEDLKDVGIELKIDKKDWAAWSKDMDEFNYSMTWAAWGASLFKDPESMWASKEADRKASNNITGFKNAEVDALVEQQKTLFDIGERHRINREIDQIVYNEFPYALLWNIDYVRLLYWNKFGTPDSVLSKYGDEQSIYGYWWYDEDAVADLESAIKSKSMLPQKPESIVFDEEFRP